jgi:molecular chaperone DnaK
MGAAIQGGVLQGEVQDLLLLDVTPLTLGIETMGAVTTPLIPRNTTIPTAKSETFTTAADGQTAVDVHVLQGERANAGDNKTIGKFKLDGILPAPRGKPQIEVSFDLDANGILNVSAKDKGTGKEQKITITASSGLSDSEIDQMVKDAEAHAEEDEERRKAVQTRNEAEGAAHAAEKMIADNPDSVSEEQKTEIEGKVTEVRSALEADDTGRINLAVQELQEAMQRVGQAVYAEQAAAAGADPDGAPPPPGDGPEDGESEDGTIEGEFKEV